MVEEADKKEEGEKPPRKKLMALIAVAVGAVLGGAGVVMFVPAHKPEPVVDKAAHKARLWRPEGVEFDFRFNPQTETGKAFGQVSFSVEILVQPGKDAAARESFDKNKDKAKSRCLELLSSQTARELQTPDGKMHIKRLLMDELTYTLFPGSKDDRIAALQDLFWTTFLIQ